MSNPQSTSTSGPVATAAGVTVPSIQNLGSESELVRVALSADYEILEELGRGGMAIVYRAKEKALDREVAIKVLPSRLAIDKDFVERFQHEARTSGRLEHPNIVPIYRVGKAGPNGEVIYFVMKFLRGQSLSAVLRERGMLEPGDVRRILMETASALGYAAKHNVVHRDIKPDNIMLDSEGRCVVTDFGIAKAPGGQQTAAGTSLGTPRYMSPEHAQGVPLDGRSDMYSLGVVAYQCLTGKTPFDSDDPFAVLYKHINEPVPEPTLVSDEQRQVYGVIARMLAKKPGDRFQTGNELISALGGQVSDPTLVATTNPGLMAPTEVMPTPLPWLRRMATRERGMWLAVCGVALLAIVGYFVNRGRKATQAAAPAATASAPANAALDSSKRAAANDSARNAAVTQAAKVATPPKPKGPSDRAAAIIAVNALKSKCPKRADTLVSSRAIPYLLVVDSIRDHKRGGKLVVNYDVCGLAKGSPFTAAMTLTKLNQRGVFGMGKQPPQSESAIETAGSPRSREKQTLDLAKLSPGAYRLDVAVTDNKKRQVTASRQFQINEQ